MGLTDIVVVTIPTGEAEMDVEGGRRAGGRGVRVDHGAIGGRGEAMSQHESGLGDRCPDDEADDRESAYPTVMCQHRVLFRSGPWRH